ncbi:hypothetical protein PM082_018683 [Marasmius tenuissimus]|nr:hypothetical protein PM082_018683 [Marasmius tenuissimus]
MMFNKLFTLAAFTTLAVATPTGLSARGDCSTGPIQCCDTVTTAKDPVVAPILALIGVIVQDLNVGVGLTCSPITVIGGGNGGWLVFTTSLVQYVDEADGQFPFRTAPPTLFVAPTTLTVASSPLAAFPSASELNKIALSFSPRVGMSDVLRMHGQNRTFR